MPGFLRWPIGIQSPSTLDSLHLTDAQRDMDIFQRSMGPVASSTLCVSTVVPLRPWLGHPRLGPWLGPWLGLHGNLRSYRYHRYDRYDRRLPCNPCQTLWHWMNAHLLHGQSHLLVKVPPCSIHILLGIVLIINKLGNKSLQQTCCKNYNFLQGQQASSSQLGPWDWKFHLQTTLNHNRYTTV